MFVNRQREPSHRQPTCPTEEQTPPPLPRNGPRLLLPTRPPPHQSLLSVHTAHLQLITCGRSFLSHRTCAFTRCHAKSTPVSPPSFSWKCFCSNCRYSFWGVFFLPCSWMALAFVMFFYPHFQVSDPQECIHTFYSLCFIHSLCLSRLATPLSAVPCIRLTSGFRNTWENRIGNRFRYDSWRRVYSTGSCQHFSLFIPFSVQHVRPRFAQGGRSSSALYHILLKGRFWATQAEGVDSGKITSAGGNDSTNGKETKTKQKYYRKGNHRSCRGK